MKKIFFLSVALIAFQLAYGQKSTKNKLLGVVTEEALQEAPFDSWYEPTFAAHNTALATIEQLKNINWDSKTAQLFFGTWCGDSRREVPKMLKFLHEIGFPMEQLQIIAVNNTRKQYKQSPTHEEVGLNIIRVPTLIFYQSGQEMNRFVEYPRETLEADLLKILQKKDYTPQYSEAK